MRGIIVSIVLWISFIGKCLAQDTTIINDQPNWTKAFDISSHSSFYEDNALKPLAFSEISKQIFEPFNKRNHERKSTNKPLIIQWYRFSIYNSSTLHTVDLRLDLGTHYFTQLYANQKLIALGGAFQNNVLGLTYFNLPFKIAPSTTVTFFARTEDRQSQFVKPHIRLKTPFIAAIERVDDNHKTRLLFILLSGLSGCLFFICIYAIYQYYLYRDEAFKWYIAYTAVSFINCLHWMDIRLQIFIFSPLARDVIFSTFIFLTPILYSLFIGKMLKFSVNFKKGWLFVKILISIAILQMLIQFLEVHFGVFLFPPNWYSALISILPMAILNVILLVLTAKSKDAVKWFLFVGLASMLVFWCFGLSGVFAMLPTSTPELFLIFIFQPAFMMIGITIEAICFSFALSYRSKLVLVDKNNLQVIYQQQLEQALKKRTIELNEQSKIIETQKIKQIQTTFEHQIAATQMTALRAQTNPHFIFNCLNSIQLYTLENNAAAASEYLTKFSKLIRLVLENSHQSKVSLLKELETLQLYIELEAMRFKDKVQYEINVQPSIDQQYIEIPPLLLQPYVENAIWHGLMPKKEGGLIKIEVNQLAESLLSIEITDNGIGRELANQIKSKSATKNKSYGMQITSERIHLINQLYKINTDVKIVDLRDEQQNAIGTKVEIQIPI